VTGDLVARLRARLARRRPTPPPRASQAAIAVLEHDLYGVQPEPRTLAYAAIGLRALANSGTSLREMMHAMSDCTATGTILIGDEPIAVICNLAPHKGGQHHDVVHGDWTSKDTPA
jgi:hypothetical protein